ncbi:MAG TPA: hypothetical protein VMD27_12470 [Candidatus Aquilonibacter sp.]|nr:hypothetical protein [Candidatus Aquilonibacter sp.]
MKHSKELTTLIAKANVHVRSYVAELENENAKLVKRLAEIEAKYVTAQNKIEVYQSGKNPESVIEMTDQELMRIAKGKAA